MSKDMVVLARALSPGKNLPAGMKTSGDAWDADSDEVDITLSGAIIPEYLHVSVKTNKVFLLVNSSADNPTTDGSWYEPDQTHIIACRNYTLLHYKSETSSAAGVIHVTVFGNAPNTGF